MARLPFLPRLLLRLTLPVRDREFIIGDLDEEYMLRQRPRGVIRARLWYWRQAFWSIASETHYEMGSAPTVELGEPGRANMFDALRQDLRYAARSLNRRPVFTTVAVLTLALGIGANTGIFSVANWLLFRPVPGVNKQEQLAIVEFAEAPGQTSGISWLNLADMLARQRSFSALAGFGRTTLQVLATNAEPQQIGAEAVGGDYFGVLGLRVQLGRPILPQETVTGRPTPVAVITDQLWTELFQRDPNVIGRTFTANKVSLTVVGVAPAGFHGVVRNGDIQAWVPQSMSAELRHMSADYLLGRRAGVLRELVGRLRPGATVESARSELQAILDDLRVQYPEENAFYAKRPVIVHEGIGVQILLRERTGATVKLMMLVVVMLLLISSANVGNMLLVRGIQQRADAAVRRALGASFSRLIRQTLTEAVVLSVCGGMAGLVLAAGFLKLIEGGQLLGLPPIENVRLDLQVILFTLTISVATGLLFGLAPALVLRHATVANELQTKAGRYTVSNRGIRSVIGVVQIALSLSLLVGALLLTSTLRNLQRVDLGFDARRIAGLYVNAEPQGYTRAQLPALQRRMLDQFRSAPEIEGAALAYAVPFMGMGYQGAVNDPLARSEKVIALDIQLVTDGYFDVLQLPILRGRAIEERDWTTPGEPVSVVLSERAAAELFGHTDPLGRILIVPLYDRKKELRVVGIAKDSRISGIHEPVPLLMYQPITEFPSTQISLVMRSRGNAAALEPVARRLLASVDPGFPGRFQLVSENVRKSIAEQRLLANMFALFSVVAVLLSAIGLYGLLAFMVGERTREFGIRLALGANTARVARLVARQAGLMVVLGVLIGMLGARWLSGLIRSTLFGVDVLNPAVYLIAIALFVGVCTLAAAVPTRAALRLQPTIALRHE
jgi:putative ABC transport system permease protein